MQGKDRDNLGRKKELKVACFYEGFEVESINKITGEIRYSCKNKRSLCGFEKSESFLKRKEEYIERIYKIKDLLPRVINSDGAYWCKFDKDWHFNTYLQLDKFHVFQAIARGKLSKKQQEEIKNLIRSNKPRLAIEMLENIYKDNKRYKRNTKINANYQLLHYLKENERALIPYTKNKKFMRLLSTKLPKNTILKDLSTMESTVQSLVALRMKKRKCSFIKEGAIALCNIIILKREKRLDEKIFSLEKKDNDDITKECAIPVLNKGLEIISDLKKYSS
jgi:hypothetical protein